MNIWQELEKVNIKNKERYVEIFRNLIKNIRDGKYDFKDKEEKDYYIINEKKNDEKFVYIVPLELINLFHKMRASAPNEFLGFTILVNETRICCFGIPCSELSKAVIEK